MCGLATSPRASDPTPATAHSGPQNMRARSPARGMHSAVLSPAIAAVSPATVSSIAKPIASGPTAASAPAAPERQSMPRSSTRKASRTVSRTASRSRLEASGITRRLGPRPRMSV